MSQVKVMMSEYNVADYTFFGLCNKGEPLDATDSLTALNSLVYLVGLVSSSSHGVLNLRIARGTLRLLFDFEEQQKEAVDLLSWQKLYLPKGYYPQTPCMLTKAWSPIAAMLEQGFDPVVLNREQKRRATASGIWRPVDFESSKGLNECETYEQLFWAILSEAFRRAKARRAMVSIIAKPGYSYELKIGSLQHWSDGEIVKSGRILWKRTPECG